MARAAREGNEGFLTRISPALLAPVAAGELTRIEFQFKARRAGIFVASNPKTDQAPFRSGIHNNVGDGDQTIGNGPNGGAEMEQELLIQPEQLANAHNMNIHLNHNGQQMGTFAREQVEGMIRGGVITYETLACAEGQTMWRPLHDIIGAPVSPPLPPATQTPISKQIHPVVAYFVWDGRRGRVMWFLCNLMNLLGYWVLDLLLCWVFNLGDNLNFFVWGLPLSCLFMYLTIVNAGKRLHDLNFSAWLSFLLFPLVPFFLLFLLILSGTKGPNKYGPEERPVTVAPGGHSSLRSTV